MGSQFVDLNGDGHLDYLSATFDGSPHVAFGSEEGFGEPTHLLDADGERILISYFWNYEDRAHQVTGRAMGTEQPEKQRCISALAFDWDGDGDHDLLLGSYEGGRLYRQMNEGSDAEPAFTGRNIPVMAGDEPWALEAKMTAPRLVDWDGDGDLDLIAGSFGDSYQKATGGGVYLSINDGAPGKPAFGALQTLIPPSPKGESQPTRPDAGLYADAVDYDGDGDLDLVVGGYSMWTPQPRELTDDEQATAARLQRERDEIRARLEEIDRELLAEVEAAAEGLERTSPEWREKYTALARKYADERAALSKKSTEVTAELNELIPADQRRSFVWWYERL